MKHQPSRKFFQWEMSCSRQKDRRTDMKTLIVAFRNLANAPKKAKIFKTKLGIKAVGRTGFKWEKKTG